MATRVFPRWSPHEFERSALIWLLEFGEPLRTTAAAVAPAVGDQLDFDKTVPAPRFDFPAGTGPDVFARVPWREGPEPDVLPAVYLFDTPLDRDALTQKLRQALVAMWQGQLREWSKDPERPGRRFHAALLLVIHLGGLPWKFEVDVESLRSVPPELSPFDPKFKLLFLGLSAASPAALVKPGRFGYVLALLAAARAHPGVFLPAWEDLLATLDEMPKEADEDRCRWLWLAIHLMVFRREVGEFPRLRQSLLGAFSDAKRRREAEDMLRTVFDSCSEIGELRARREVLLDLMRTKFGDLPPEDVEHVNRMQNRKMLDFFLRRVVAARDLDDMGLWDSGVF